MNIKFRENFGDLLNNMELKGNGLEIGVNKADFSKVILKTSNLSKIYLLDAWMEMSSEEGKGWINIPQKEQDDMYNKVVIDMMKYGSRVEIIRDKSLEAVKRFDDGFFDFIYIDANHDYKHAKEDVEAWYPKVKEGGIFAGHDYLDGAFRRVTYGVKSAVDEFCRSNGKKVLLTNEKKNMSWYFIK